MAATVLEQDPHRQQGPSEKTDLELDRRRRRCHRPDRISTGPPRSCSSSSAGWGLVLGLQLREADNKLVTQSSTTSSYTMHGTTIIFLGVMPCGDVFNYLTR